MSKYKIIHYRENCIGCNSCTEHAPGNWEIDQTDGKANLKRSTSEKANVFISEISDLELEDNQRAVQDCPVGIIHILNTDGKNVVS